MTIEQMQEIATLTLEAEKLRLRATKKDLLVKGLIEIYEEKGK